MTMRAASSAVITADGLYRYWLRRQWGTTLDLAVWIMLNPSTADADIDDPTIRRCIGFTKRLGLDGLAVVNLYALRCTKPIHLTNHPDPVGPHNDRYISAALAGAAVTIAAWGAYRCPDNRDVAVEQLLADHGQDVRCLGRTEDDAPRLPLYVRGHTPFEAFL